IAATAVATELALLLWPAVAAGPVVVAALALEWRARTAASLLARCDDTVRGRGSLRRRTVAGRPAEILELVAAPAMPGLPAPLSVGGGRGGFARRGNRGVATLPLRSVLLTA